jgi:hypothetical protein
MRYRMKFILSNDNIGVRTLGSLLMIAAFSLVNSAQAAGPQSPCIVSERPLYPSPDAAPTIAIWHAAELARKFSL